MSSSQKIMPLMGTPLAVNFSLLSENQALKNHRQTLERLAERGGLSPCEALALAENRAWVKMDTDEALKKLFSLVLSKLNMVPNNN